MSRAISTAERRILAALAFSSVALVAAPARADIILQTATLGPTGHNVGGQISTNQYLGVRFQTTQTVNLTSVQIHVLGSTSGNGLVFAAILPLSSLSAFPNAGNPGLIADDNPIEVHTFTASTLSEVVTIPFSSSLPAGIYTLVFGSGEFGATGQAQAANNNTTIGTPSHYFRGSSFTFTNSSGSNAYFVVNGTVVGPEPGAFGLLALGSLAGLYLHRRRR